MYRQSSIEFTLPLAIENDNKISKLSICTLSSSITLCVCVCAREIERERERVGHKVCYIITTSVYVAFVASLLEQM